MESNRAEDITAIDTESTYMSEGMNMHTMKMGICISNVSINISDKACEQPCTCSYVEGITSGVTPKPCNSLPDQDLEKIKACDFPQEILPIDMLELKQCSYHIKYASHFCVKN